MMRGEVSRQFTRWISRNIRAQGTSFTFSLREIMDAHGMNYDSKHDYFRALHYFKNQRRAIEKAMELFWAGEDYKEYKGGGHSEDEIFNALIYAGTTADIFPMWSDPYDHQYRLFDLNGYLDLKERRARAIKTEIERSSKELETAIQHIPQIEQRYEKPQLIGDGTFIELPAPRPYCSYCGLRFERDDQVVDHIEKKHKYSTEDEDTLKVMKNDKAD